MSRVQETVFLLVLLSILCVLPVRQSNGLPVEKKDEADTSEPVAGEDDGRRATWLETRTLEENFNHRVFLALQQLSAEGLINPDTVKQDKMEDKRGRHQGFCFRKTKSGRFLPYICWKEGDQAD